MKRSRRIGRVAAIGFVALMMACTSDRSPTTPTQTKSVTIANFAFSPASIVVAVGSTVTWTNTDGTAHTTTSDASGWDSGALAQNASFSHTFTTKGTFAYHCTFHSNMHGTVTVQ